MSVENLKNYGRTCAESPELAAKAKEIGVDNIPGQIEHAKSLGFEWDADDLKALAAETGEDISDRDLEDISTNAVTVSAVAAVVGAGAAVAATTAGSGW